MGCLEAPDLGNEHERVPKKAPSKKATTRRYTVEEKERSVRLLRTLREELGEERGCAKRVADQLGFGVESVRTWVRQADIDDGAHVHVDLPRVAY